MSKKRRKKKGQKRARPNVPRSSPNKGAAGLPRRLEQARHVYPDGWQPDDWLVPYDDDDCRSLSSSA